MNIDMNLIIQVLSYALIGVGAMAFLVSVITQVIKELPYLKTFPTQLVVIVLSIVLCPACLAAFFSWKGLTLTWYIVFACVLVSMVVAFVAMYGWDTLSKLWDRTRYPHKNEGFED